MKDTEETAASSTQPSEESGNSQTTTPELKPTASKGNKKTMPTSPLLAMKMAGANKDSLFKGSSGGKFSGKHSQMGGGGNKRHNRKV